MTTVAGPEAGSVAPHRPATTVLLHLVLGVLGLLGYVLLLPVTQALGLPSTAALAAAGLLVIPAMLLGTLDMRRRRPLEPVIALRPLLTFPRTPGRGSARDRLAGATFILTAPLTQTLQTHVFACELDASAIRLGTDGQYGGGALPSPRHCSCVEP